MIPKMLKWHPDKKITLTNKMQFMLNIKFSCIFHLEHQQTMFNTSIICLPSISSVQNH